MRGDRVFKAEQGWAGGSLAFSAALCPSRKLHHLALRNMLRYYQILSIAFLVPSLFSRVERVRASSEQRLLALFPSGWTKGYALKMMLFSTVCDLLLMSSFSIEAQEKHSRSETIKGT